MVRTSRARSAVTALLGASPALLSVMGPAGPAAAAPTTATDPTPYPTDVNQFCSTRALSKEAIDAGATSTILCYPSSDASLRAVGIDPADTRLPAARRALGAKTASIDTTGLVAVHHTLFGGSGTALSVSGSTCGGGIAFNSGDAWNDTISSTSHGACGNIKHFVDNTNSGTNQITAAARGAVVDMNGTLNNTVSSVNYYEPVQ